MASVRIKFVDQFNNWETRNMVVVPRVGEQVQWKFYDPPPTVEAVIYIDPDFTRDYNVLINLG